MEKLSFNRTIFYIVIFSVVFIFMNQSYSQEYENDEKPDSLKKELTYPSRFDNISVLDCWRNDVLKYYGKGYYTEEGGHLGTTYYTNSTRSVVLCIIWGVDWHVDEISFSYGDVEDLPKEIKSIKQFPDSAISQRLKFNSALEGWIRLGIQSEDIYKKYGKPKTDTVDGGYRYLTYETDYETTKDVLSYEATFKFKDNHLIRFEIYNGE